MCLSNSAFHSAFSGDETISEIERIQDFNFASDFTSAQNHTGEILHFTRSEARALAALTRAAKRLVTREQLLDALGGEGSDKNDRTVDFLINRLRRKLSDDARNPRYIATRYGEGYIWIADLAPSIEDFEKAHMIVGPIQGLHLLGDQRNRGELLAREILRAVKAELSPDFTVAYAVDCPPASAFQEAAPRQSIELTFFLAGDELNCIVTAREFRTGLILAMQRAVLNDRDTPLSEAHRVAEKVVTALLNQSWRALATRAESEGPLPVSMIAATTDTIADGSTQTDSNRKLFEVIEQQQRQKLAVWRQTDRRLKELRAADPDDPQLKILQGIHIHTKYVTLGLKLFAEGIDTRAEDEAIIETLALEALPYVQTVPEYAIMAAKLLHFVDQGYADLAKTLAEDAYRSSVSIARSMTVIGQLRAFAGETDGALQCLEQALNLAKPGSQSHLYTLIIKCQALIAAGRWNEVKSAKQELYSMSAPLSLFLEPLFTDPDRPSFRAKAAMLTFNKTRAGALLQFNHYVSSRLFTDPAHRSNAIRTPLTMVTRRFGPDVLPHEIRTSYPDLVPLRT